MPFQEDLSEFLDLDGGFASKALITTAQGLQRAVEGIFSAEYMDIDGGMSGVAGCRPRFECARAAIAGVDYDDFLEVNDRQYRIRGIRPDGTGWVVLVLEEQ